MDTAAPYAPVVAAGERRTIDIDILRLEHLIVLLETVEIGIFCAHRAVEHAEALGELLRVVEDREVRIR